MVIMAGVFRKGISQILGVKQKIRYLLPTFSQVRSYTLDDDGDVACMKTTVNFLNRSDAGIFFETYSEIGFRLNSGLTVIGPCAVFPRSLLHWNVRNVEDISEESLSLFTILEPKLDILVIGVGERKCLPRFNPKLVQYLRSKRIGMEILPTDQALATFNFLNSERRYVAAALIPPAFIPVDDDVNVDEEIYLTDSIDDVFSEYENPHHGEVDAHFKKAKEQFFKWRKETGREDH